MFETGTTIDSLKANEAYDVLVVSISPDGNKGLGTEKTNTTTGSATSAPGTPSAPTVERSGRGWIFRGTPPFSSEPIKDYDWEIDPSSGSNIIVEHTGNILPHTEDGTSSVSTRARFRARNIYDQVGSYSAYSSSLSSEKWSQGHLNDNSVGNPQLQNNSVGNTELQNLSVGNAQIQTLAVGNAEIQNLAVQNAKIASLAVDEFKRIGVDIESSNFSFIATINRKIGQTLTFNNFSSVLPVVSLTMASNHEGHDRLIGAAYLRQIAGSTISSRIEIGNFGGSGDIGVSGTQTVYYW